MVIVPRTTVWPGTTPHRSDGSLRPLLKPGRPYLTVHYTGGGLWLDPDDTPVELTSIQRYAQGAGKPWEYNYVIDGQGVVWEYAGLYEAAHSAGENDLAIGVLLLVGLANMAMLTGFEPMPDPMVASLRWLRAHLCEVGALAADHDIRQHREMPGAATICPGPEVVKRWWEITAPAPIPPVEATTPTEPPWQPAPGPCAPSEEASVFIGFYRLDTDLAVFAVYTGGYRTWVQNEPTLTIMQGLATMAGHDPAIHVVTDPNVMAALGPVLGSVPA